MMKCRTCGKEIGADSSISVKGHIMCFSCGVRALREAGVDVAWLGIENRLHHQRRRHRSGQTSLAGFTSPRAG